MEKYQALWEQTKEQIANEFDEATFESVFKDITRVVKYSNGTISVLCPSPIIRTKINKFYEKKIQRYLLSITNENVRFKFVIADEVVEEKPEVFSSANTEIILSSNLNPNYTFQSFVIGDSNKIAFRVASQVANPDQGVYVANPLYIFGGVGLGKTHLMQAIGNAIIDNDINKKVLYIFATDFIDDYTRACQSNNFDAFHQKYDDLDALLVDDIQMLSDGKKSQQEFFKLFNRMHDNEKIIVITADRPADQLKDIMDRLTSRFNWGMAVDIKTPDLEHRVKILRKKLSDSSDKAVPDDVLRYIASNFSNNIRELESSLNRVIAMSIHTDRDVNIEFTKESLEPLLKNKRNGGDDDAYENVKSIVADFYGITVAELVGPKRSSQYITPRHICMYILKTKYDIPYKKIGALLGGRDYTTVMAAVTKITHERQTDEGINMALNRILSKIN